MKKLSLITLFALCFWSIQGIFAQQQELYTFCQGGNYSYLLDTSATSTSSYYARWTTGATSYSSHMMKDTIFQTYGSGSGGGSYGSIKKWACTSTTAATCVWTYTLSNAHHDICPLPNGDVLAIVDESKTSSQITTAGGSYSGSMNSPTIIQLHPTGSTTATIVWQWKLWDHLCQSVNTSVASTYVTSVAANPQLFNVRYSNTSDWFHMNGIDYNAELDQIVMSSHAMNEIYIIDHSTTTAQAATHTGGKAGHGGDFLYRWGNPATYGCTAGGNGITINVLHDVRWVSANNSKYPNYISFFHNNGGGTAQAVVFLPPHSTTDIYNYTYTAGSIIPPTSCTKPTVPSITGVQDQGGVQVLDNGNILITKPNSTFYECNGSGTTYQSITVGTVQSDRYKKCEIIGPFPTASTSSSEICLNNSITLSSSAKAPLQTSPTYTYSWSSTPSGFTSTLQNPTVTPTIAGAYTYVVTVSSGGCSNTAAVHVVIDDCTGTDEAIIEGKELNLFPNPTSGIINLNEEFTYDNNYSVIVYNSYGDIITRAENSKYIDLSACPDGIYFLSVKTNDKHVINKKIILIK
jgi:hypothetical protein